MGWLENIAGGFTILILASLIFLVVGFLLHSTGGDLDDEEAKPSPLKEALTGLFFLASGAIWAYYFASEWGSDESDRLTLITSAIWLVISVVWATQHLRTAMIAK